MSAGVVSTGDISGDYSTLGVVGVHVDNKDSETQAAEGCGGCGGPTEVRVYVTIEQTYQRGADALLSAAKAKGGNAVIFAKFEHRIALETLANAGGNIAAMLGQKDAKNTVTNQVVELFCYGTAVSIDD